MKRETSFQSVCRSPACIAFLLAGVLGTMAPVRGEEKPGALALALNGEQQWGQAALEFRRLALSEDDGLRAAGWYWLAAWEYSRAGDEKRGWKYANRAEDADAGRELDLPLAWLRARLAEGDRDWPATAFYYDSLQRKAEAMDSGEEAVPWLAAAARGSAAAQLRDGNPSAALSALDGLPDAGEADASRAAVRDYAAQGDKRPWVGGVLGLVPGLGYAYSGEYGNMLRSMLLNGLFMWAMYETADDDEWALFGVCTFCELTWYTGSIYGGIDAAHRHNRDRLERAVSAVQGDGGNPTPDWSQIPLVRLKFSF